MRIKKKLVSFVLTLGMVLSFGQAINVHAATSTSDINVINSSSSVPNPGIPEGKPDALNVIAQYSTLSGNNTDISKVNITSSIGWKNINGYWYYYKSDNTRATGWIKPDRNWYFLRNDGKMATGWLYSDGKWYYLGKSGNMITGWKQINNTWYFFNYSGAMATGLNAVDNKTYMFYSSGAMATGWLKLSNRWYYFNYGGSMATGWITNNGVRYYLYDTGAMAKGWINLSGTWYYLNTSGAMAKGWVSSGSDYYYLDTYSGSLITNTTKDGYIIGSDGKRTGTGKFKGIDISHHNGNIDFTKVKADGIQAVYMKATEGTTFVDNYLGTYYNGARSAGLKTGFYHFLVGTSSPETQAQNFYNNIKDKQSDLKPVLDVEKGGFDVMDYTLRFIAEFKRLSNMDVCIYSYSYFIDTNLDSRLSKYTLWEANYSKSPFNLSPNKVWTSRAGHQYTDKGTINGISTNVDLNEFTQDIFK